ncbi:hypothetical protein [Subtercola lobariae]|uniref:Uncharacterized protein n=1 Tax=Subtercola lobariae TaxID=1588641 RepID=A0A917B9C3_9MICO|nr:hypothetical protein [Subtercola lobariae]GGF31455.1 hypothetical protein GCM10011399_25760 [Subtercola lobariae]
MSDESVTCIVFGCARVADEFMTFTVCELHLVYAVCCEHANDRRQGAYFAAPEHANRGFVGLQSMSSS